MAFGRGGGRGTGINLTADPVESASIRAETSIEIWLAQRNAKPKPFKWTAKANIIPERNARGRRALD
jgi:hypothetical protein